MRWVRCGECGKKYDFDVDDFCPKCGAFNSPARSTQIGADGSVVRVDGLNEANHRESFVHAELHEENRERRVSGLSKGVKRSAPRPTVRRAPIKKEKKAVNIGDGIRIAIIVIVLINFLRVFLYSLFF